MTTRVPIRYGGTGANTASDARTALGVPPLAAYDVANSASSTANAAYSQANTAYSAANTANTNALNAYSQANAAYSQANAAYNAANNVNHGKEDHGNREDISQIHLMGKSWI